MVINQNSMQRILLPAILLGIFCQIIFSIAPQPGAFLFPNPAIEKTKSIT